MESAILRKDSSDMDSGGEAHGKQRRGLDGAEASKGRSVERRAAEHAGSNVFIFLRLDGARGIDEAAARSELSERHAQNGRLQSVKLSELFGPEAPANFGMARQRAGAGTGRIEKNAIEDGSEGQRAGGVEFHRVGAGKAEARELRLHSAEAMRVTVSGDDETAGLGGANERGRFSSWRGAEIENAVAGANAEKHGNRLRSFVLYGDLAGAKCIGSRGASARDGESGLEQKAGRDVKSGILERANDFGALPEIMDGTGETRGAIVGLEQRDGTSFIEAREPAFNHPRGMRVKNAQAFGRWKTGRKESGDRRGEFSSGAAKDCVDERGRGRLACHFHHLDGFVNSSARRNSFEEAKLIKPQSQGEDNLKIETVERLFEMALDEEVEKATPAENAEGQFGRQRGISRLNAGVELAVKDVCGIGALGFDAAQNFEGDLSGDADGHGIP